MVKVPLVEFIIPTAMVVIFAMLCSKPQSMKVRIHHMIMMSFPASLFSLMLHHTAIHTRVLQSRPFSTRLMAGAVIFFSAAAAKSCPTVPEAAPLAWKIKAAIRLPTRFQR